MPSVTLKAHYDGDRIQLDEPFEIPPNTALLVTVLTPTEEVTAEDWLAAARSSLARAYGPDEPDYTADDLEPPVAAMNDGDVVLTPLPQADGRIKNRPAIVLRTMPPHGDLLVCGVSTQLRHEVPGFDEVIEPEAPDFASSGLKARSLIRLGFLVVLPASSFLGAIGSIGAERHRRLLVRLAQHLLGNDEDAAPADET